MKTGEWRPLLKGGVPDAVKLLTELDWESVLNDVRFMKWGLTFNMLPEMLLYYMISQIFGFLFIYPLLLFTHIPYELVSLGALVFTVPLTFYIGRSSLKEYYRKLGSIDYLLWSLRWFYHESKGAELEA